ncbi:hypothetical protein FHL15_004491 [Xylaria flabelliformis]|uniref:2EXR domain-containing protein n=1 Tax=Xylaria flabelliformis TaxID=2512241 RepID=A0A553I3D4_9PEZI|nr:hypothetical protein FHL15_004491 [Xylaria flabelliformis]
MAAQRSKTDFLFFSSLPPELRQLIWKESVLISMENPEVLVLVPRRARFGKYAISKSSPFPPVNTAFPVAMHVNHESRCIALLYTQMIDLGPYPWHKCLVPQRPFRPEIDTLYAARTTDPHEEYSMEELVEVRHLALDYRGNITTDMLHLFGNILNHMPALRTVRFILPKAQINLCDGLEQPLLPHRRCMLRHLGDNEFKQTRALSRELQRQRDKERSSHSGWPLAVLPGAPLAQTFEQMRDQLEWAVLFGAERFNITFGVSLITEFCHSPSGNSRFVAAGEEFPDSSDPSVFAALNSPRP